MSEQTGACAPNYPKDINDIIVLAHRIHGLIKLADYLAFQKPLMSCEEHCGIDCLISAQLRHMADLVADLEAFELELPKEAG